jgi:VWFA-related protein
MTDQIRGSDRTPTLTISAGVGLLFGLVLGVTTYAAPQESSSSDYKIAVDVSRVVLDVTVYDRQGRLIPGLAPKDFRVLEDGVEQKILNLTQEDRPLTLGLVVDSSRSIGESRPEVIEGAMRLSKLSHPEDDVFLVSFNDTARFGLPRDSAFTRDLPTLRNALFDMKPEGRTALYDAVVMALAELDRGGWDRKAAVIFSDGGDTASTETLEDALERVQRSNALIYAIGLGSDLNPYRSPKILKQLARASGGEAYFPEAGHELQKVCESIATEMRSQYTLTYAPSNARREGRYRDIEVRLVSPTAKHFRIRAREGYYELEATETAERLK